MIVTDKGEEIIKFKGIKNAQKILSRDDFVRLFKGNDVIINQSKFYRDFYNLTLNIKDTKFKIKGLKNKEINDLFNREITVYNPKILAIVKLNDNQTSLGSGVGPNNNNLLINKVNIIPGTNTPILLPAPKNEVTPKNQETDTLITIPIIIPDKLLPSAPPL